jgi:hypothetical protein
MQITLDDGSKIDFDESEDHYLSARYVHFNTYVFDGTLPATTIRWAVLLDDQGFCAGNGCLMDKHSQLDGPYIFIDKRLENPRLRLLVDLILLHEMCHHRVSGHGSDFVKELLRALQRDSWQPLASKCVPNYKLAELED